MSDEKFGFACCKCGFNTIMLKPYKNLLYCHRCYDSLKLKMCYKDYTGIDLTGVKSESYPMYKNSTQRNTGQDFFKYNY